LHEKGVGDSGRDGAAMLILILTLPRTGYSSSEEDVEASRGGHGYGVAESQLEVQ